MSAARVRTPSLGTIVTLWFVLGCWAGASAQTVQFAKLDTYTDERDFPAGVIVELTISEAPTSFVSVSWSTFDDTAESGVDYTGASGPASWPAGDDTPKQLFMTILPDSEPEDAERFGLHLTFASGVTIAEPDTTYVTIVANDQTAAYIDVGSSIPNDNGDYVLFGLPEEELALTVRLREFPSSPVSVDFTSNLTPASGSLLFDGTQEQPLVLSVPGLGAGEAYLRGTVSVSPSAGARGADPSSVEVVAMAPIQGLLYCLECLVEALKALSYNDGCPFACGQLGICKNAPSQTVASDSDVIMLQAYRDQILDSTDAGRYYIAKYREHSEAAGIALLRRPWFLFDVWSASRNWFPAFRALVDGDGASATITLQMQSDLLALLDVFEAEGSPELATFLAAERDRLHLDALAGLTMSEFQTQIETLGGPMAARTSSWGGLKARFHP